MVHQIPRLSILCPLIDNIVDGDHSQRYGKNVSRFEVSLRVKGKLIFPFQFFLRFKTRLRILLLCRLYFQYLSGATMRGYRNVLLDLYRKNRTLLGLHPCR